MEIDTLLPESPDFTYATEVVIFHPSRRNFLITAPHPHIGIFLLRIRNQPLFQLSKSVLSNILFFENRYVTFPASPSLSFETTSSAKLINGSTSISVLPFISIIPFCVDLSSSSGFSH